MPCARVEVCRRRDSARTCKFVRNHLGPQQSRSACIFETLSFRCFEGNSPVAVPSQAVCQNASSRDAVSATPCLHLRMVASNPAFRAASLLRRENFRPRDVCHRVVDCRTFGTHTAARTRVATKIAASALRSFVIVGASCLDRGSPLTIVSGPQK